jgi:hypothetical protein
MAGAGSRQKESHDRVKHAGKPHVERGWECDGQTENDLPPVAPVPLAAAPLRTSSRAPTYAPMPTPVQRSRRPTSAPVRNRFNSSISSFFSSPLFYRYLGYPSRHPHQPDRSPPFVRDFRPRLAAFPARRLHGRLDGQSPAVGLQKRHQPRTIPSPCRHQSVSSLGGRVRRVVREPGVN